MSDTLSNTSQHFSALINQMWSDRKWRERIKNYVKMSMNKGKNNKYKKFKFFKLNLQLTQLNLLKKLKNLKLLSLFAIKKTWNNKTKEKQKYKIRMNFVHFKYKWNLVSLFDQ